MSDSPHRVRFFFWLNMEKANEENIADIIEKLKNSRRYTAAIRDGLRLFWDLSQGKTEVLLELFPFVKTALADGEGDTSKLEMLLDEIQGLKKSFDEKPQTLASGGLKPLGGLKPIAPLAYNEDEDMLLPVAKAEGGGNEATQNFLKSMMALQQ